MWKKLPFCPISFCKVKDSALAYKMTQFCPLPFERSERFSPKGVGLILTKHSNLVASLCIFENFGPTAGERRIELNQFSRSHMTRSSTNIRVSFAVSHTSTSETNRSLKVL